MTEETDFSIKLKEYLKEGGKKKNYSLYLDEEYVNTLKNKLNSPISKIVNDFLESLVKAIQKMEEEKKQDKQKKEGEGDGQK